MNDSFKSMSSAPRRSYEEFLEAPETCDWCGGPVYTGDWPFCNGDATKHRREY